MTDILLVKMMGTTLLFAATLWFCGLSRATASSIQQQTPAVTRTTGVYDGFEGATLSDLWRTNRFAPGAVTIQSKIVRAGHSAAMITLLPREMFEPGPHGDKDTERAELLESRNLRSRENIGYEQSFSLFLPASFPIVSTRLVIAQWKQDCTDDGPCSDDSPVLAIRYSSGVMEITQTIRGKKSVLYSENKDIRNRWLDFRFRTRFTYRPNGQIKMWLNGEQLVNFKGVTANPDTAATGYPKPSFFYFKVGLYRDVMPGAMTIYVDEYRKRQLRDDEF